MKFCGEPRLVPQSATPGGGVTTLRIPDCDTADQPWSISGTAGSGIVSDECDMPLEDAISEATGFSDWTQVGPCEWIRQSPATTVVTLPTTPVSGFDEVLPGLNHISVRHNFGHTDDVPLFVDGVEFKAMRWNPVTGDHHALPAVGEDQEVCLTAPSENILDQGETFGIEEPQPTSTVNVSNSLQLASVLTSASGKRIVLSDGVYEGSFLATSQSNFVIEAQNPGQAVFSDLLTTPLTFTKVAGFSDIYEIDQALANDIEQIHFDNGDGKRRRLAITATSTLPLTDLEMDSHPGGGWRYVSTGTIRIKVPGGGPPSAGTLFIPNDNFLHKMELRSCDNFKVEGISFEHLGKDALRRILVLSGGCEDGIIRNVSFKHVRQMNIDLSDDSRSILIEDGVHEDCTEDMTYFQVRNSSTGISGGSHLDVCSIWTRGERIFARNNKFSGGLRAFSVTSTTVPFKLIEISDNEMSQMRGAQIRLGGRNASYAIVSYNNVADRYGWGWPSNEESSDALTYWINNHAVNGNEFGPDLWETVSGVLPPGPTFLSLQRFGAADLGKQGQIFYHHNTLHGSKIYDSEEHSTFQTVLGTSSKEWHVGCEFTNNIFARPSASWGNGSNHLFYNCCVAGNSAANLLAWFMNDNQWFVFGDNDDNMWNSTGSLPSPGTHNLSDWVTLTGWEADSVYQDPQMAITGPSGILKPTSRKSIDPILGVTGNPVYNSVALAGATV